MEDDEDDEDLQMALAYSLSELEAQQRVASSAQDFISGGGQGGVANVLGGGVKKEVAVVGEGPRVGTGEEREEDKEEGVRGERRLGAVGSTSSGSPSPTDVQGTVGGSVGSGGGPPGEWAENGVQAKGLSPQKKKKCRCVVS